MVGRSGALTFVEVVHEVDLLDVVEVVVQDFHEQVNELQVNQLVLVHVAAQREVKARVLAVNELVRAELRERARPRSPAFRWWSKGGGRKEGEGKRERVGWRQ